MGATHTFVALAADDELLGQLRVALAGDDEEAMDAAYEALFDAAERPESFVEWDGATADAADLLRVVRPQADPDLWWADSEQLADSMVTYQPAAVTARVVASLGDLSRDELRQVAFERQWPRERRDTVADVTLSILAVMRYAARHDVGLLIEFSV